MSADIFTTIFQDSVIPRARRRSFRTKSEDYSTPRWKGLARKLLQSGFRKSQKATRASPCTVVELCEIVHCSMTKPQRCSKGEYKSARKLGHDCTSQTNIHMYVYGIYIYIYRPTVSAVAFRFSFGKRTTTVLFKFSKQTSVCVCVCRHFVLSAPGKPSNRVSLVTN